MGADYLKNPGQLSWYGRTAAPRAAMVRAGKHGNCIGGRRIDNALGTWENGSRHKLTTAMQHLYESQYHPIKDRSCSTTILKLALMILLVDSAYPLSCA
jgi:hypothetical protein